jgi:hypothetical protein
VKASHVAAFALLTGGAFAIAYYATKSTLAKPALPATPKSPATPGAPPVKPGPKAPSTDFAGMPPKVPGFEAITVACSLDGELNPYTDIEMGRYIESISDPVVLDNIATSLLLGVPPCTSQAEHATARAAQVRELLAAAKKAQSPWA